MSTDKKQKELAKSTKDAFRRPFMDKLKSALGLEEEEEKKEKAKEEKKKGFGGAYKKLIKRKREASK